MIERWQTYCVTGHYVKPAETPQTYLIEYERGTRIGNAVAFETEVYCPNPLEVHQKARLQVSQLNDVPYSAVKVERVEAVKYE
jgi:hypothetical protein